MDGLSPRLPASLVAETFRRSGAARWGLREDELGAALEASVQSGAGSSNADVRRYVERLHVEDLALACACALGREPAWDHFVLQHRPVLYRASDALDPSGGARELADGLYGELYGVRGDASARSLFTYFHGRSSLATWLRAVLSQRFVDRYRRSRREQPLPEEEQLQPRVERPPVDPDRERLVPLLHRALRAAIDQLPTRDRLRLRSYHVAGLTLAQIGRITGEHEATVSRQLARIRKDVRQAAERWLQESGGLDRARIARAFELSVDDPGELDLARVFGDERKESR